MRQTVPTRADNPGLYDRTIRVAVWPPTTRLFQKKLTPDLPPPAYDAACHASSPSGKHSVVKLPRLPWDVVRLIVRELCNECIAATEASSATGSSQVQVSTSAIGSRSIAVSTRTAELPPKYADALRSLYRDASRLSIVDRATCKESRSLLFRRVDVTGLPLKSFTRGLASFFGSKSNLSIGSHVQTLRIKAVSCPSACAGIIRSCTNLKVLELEVRDTQKDECLIECLQGAIASSPNLREVHLCDINSVKSISVALSLPYRLQVLALEGFKDRMGHFWDNPHDRIDTEELHLSKCIIGDWDFHFLGGLCGQNTATGPSIFKLTSSVVDFAKTNQSLLASVSELHVVEAQQLLKLDEFAQFPHLCSLHLGSRHDFVTLVRPWPQLQVLQLLICTHSVCKMMTRFLNQDLLPGLRELAFAKDAFDVPFRDRPDLQILCGFEETLRDRPSLQVKPCYPMEGFAQGYADADM